MGKDKKGDSHIAHVYHASDGFVGTYDQVAAHEKEHGLHWDSHGGHDPPPHELPNVMKDSNEHAAHIYHAADGFKGTFEQVEAHEKEHGLHWDKEGGHDPPPHKLKEWFASGKNKQEEEDHLAHIYHASDGFTGTFEQVEAHEKQHGLHWDSHDPPPHELKNAVKNKHVDVAHMYHAPDGFVGTYDQVVAHEKKHNLDCKHQDDPPPGWATPIANDPVGAEETKEESSMMSRMVRRTREEETCSPPPG